MQRTAIIIGANGGIGNALADQIEAEGLFAVDRLSRSGPVPFDTAQESTVEAAANTLKDQGITPELIIVATGLLHRDGHGPEKSIRDLDADWMMENYRINAIGPALVAKHFLPLMPRNCRTCFAVLSARVGSISDNRLGGWHSYRASKAALNMLIRNLAIEWQRRNPDSIIVGLHPGTVETGLSQPFKGSGSAPRLRPTEAAERLLTVLDALEPRQSGQVFANDGSVIPP